MEAAKNDFFDMAQGRSDVVYGRHSNLRCLFRWVGVHARGDARKSNAADLVHIGQF